MIANGFKILKSVMTMAPFDSVCFPTQPPFAWRLVGFDAMSMSLLSILSGLRS
jgi:hypothetical protein